MKKKVGKRSANKWERFTETNRTRKSRRPRLRWRKAPFSNDRNLVSAGELISWRSFVSASLRNSVKGNLASVFLLLVSLPANSPRFPRRGRSLPERLDPANRQPCRFDRVAGLLRAQQQYRNLPVESFQTLPTDPLWAVPKHRAFRR